MDVPMNAYGPLVLTGDGRTLRPGDEGFEEAQANAVQFPNRDYSMADFKPLGWAWGNVEVTIHADGSGELRADHGGTFNE